MGARIGLHQHFVSNARKTRLMDIALPLLIVRLVIGLGFASHGAQKLFGWFGGYGLAGTGGFFESIGFKPGKLFAGAAGASELIGGLLLALGLGGPIGPPSPSASSRPPISSDAPAAPANSLPGLNPIDSKNPPVPARP